MALLVGRIMATLTLAIMLSNRYVRYLSLRILLARPRTIIIAWQ
jgi:hypothetical protein